MDERGPVVDEARVASFERVLGVPLPDDYRSFVLSTNGGSLSASNAHFVGPRSFIVHCLSSLDDPDEGSRLNASHEYAADFPSDDLLEIGYDQGGNRVLLVVRGDHRGEVWFQRVTDGRPEGSNPRVLWHDRRDMKKLADSFDEFLGRLGPVEP
jgi:hypothetical protein